MDELIKMAVKLLKGEWIKQNDKIIQTKKNCMHYPREWECNATLTIIIIMGKTYGYPSIVYIAYLFEIINL